MAIVYSANVIEIAVIQDYAGNRAVNVWHMYHDEEFTGPGNEEIVEDFRNNWQDHVTELQNEEVTVLRFEWRSLDLNDSTVGTVLPDGAKPTTGQVTGEGMSPNVAYLVNKNTTNRPRGARDGRMFLTGVNENVVNNAGVVDPAQRNVWDGYLADFYNGISDSAFGASGDRYPVVLETTAASRAPGTNPVTIDSRRVTSITLDNLVATQRDRLR